MPVYVRAGAVIPMQALVQHTGQAPQGPLEVHAWLPLDATQPCGGALYEDDGRLAPKVRRTRFECEAANDAFVLAATTLDAGFDPWWTDVQATVHGVLRAPTAVRIRDANSSDWTYDATTRTVTVRVPDARSAWSVALSGVR